MWPTTSPFTSVTSCSPMLRMLSERAAVPYECLGRTNVSASPTPATVCEWWIASSRLSCWAIDAGFHQMPSLPGFPATIAWPMPTACAPVGSSRKREPSLPVGSCALARPAMIAESATLKRSRLIDQHDWDVVTDGIAQPTLVTEKGLLRLSILEFALALRADEDFEEARRQGHLLFPVAS